MDRILCFIIKIFILLAGLARPLKRLGIGSFDAWEPGKQLKLLIVGYNGARNTGADARVVAAVKQIRELFAPENAQISVITLDEASLEGYFDPDVRLLKISSIFPADLYRACSSHHAAILCEGSTLKSTFANALSLFFCEASGVCARQGKPCIAYGSEVGSMEDFLKKFASETCRETYFITRTRHSQDVLTQLGLNGHVGTDTAWLYEDEIEPEEAIRLLREQGWDGRQPLLGAAVIDPFCWPVRASLSRWIRAIVTGKRSDQYDKWYFYSRSEARKAAYHQYIEEITSALSRLCRERDCFPVLLGMERMDAGPCSLVRQKLDMPCALFLSKDRSADVMTGILLQLSGLITSRYHAAVLSLKRGCPIAAVSMDERLDSLMEELSLQACLHHVTDEDLGEALYVSLSEGLEKADALGEGLRHRRLAYQQQQREMGAYLKEYISDGLNLSGGEN